MSSSVEVKVWAKRRLDKGQLVTPDDVMLRRPSWLRRLWWRWRNRDSGPLQGEPTILGIPQRDEDAGQEVTLLAKGACRVGGPPPPPPMRTELEKQ